MNLASQLEGILEYSEGMKPETRDKALKETTEYYRKWQQRLINSAKEDYRKGGSYSEFHLRTMEAEQSLLKKVLKGETTYQKEASKIGKDPYKNMKRREKDRDYAALEFTLTHLFSGFYDEMESKAKKLDETIKRLYGELKD